MPSPNLPPQSARVRADHYLAVIRPGDMVVIPAGTPHQFVLAPGERITYTALKIAAGVK